MITKRRPPPLGAHVFTSGGLATTALPHARDIGAGAVQVFLSNPRGWAAAAGDPAQDERFRAGCAEDGIRVFVHAPYLVNLASPAPVTVEKSIAAVRHAVRRAVAVGAEAVVYHAGSAIAADRRTAALAAVPAVLEPLLDHAAEAGVRLLVEPTAGGGCPMASTVDELGDYLAAAGGHPALGVRLDTCHLHAAGHDLATPGGMRATLTAARRVLGTGRLGLVHANDSRDPCGSRRDRHEPVGRGTIGLDAFGELFRHPLTRTVPVVIETPGGVAEHRRDLALLDGLRRR